MDSEEKTFHWKRIEKYVKIRIGNVGEKRKGMRMLYQITDGTVSLGGNLVLSHVNFEIKGNEKIAVVGRNGAGKTTLLRLIAGELELDQDDKRQGPGIRLARRVTVGMLKQQPFADKERTVEEELLDACPLRDSFDRERFAYELEQDRLFTGFGFSAEDKKKKLKSFSGGEQTRLALIRLLLLKPDILLLDEPTNHLDLEAVQWLEQYLKEYENAVVMVSHDRFFLDQTAGTVYEIEGKKLIRYAGNYTEYRAAKRKRLELQKKAYARQQEEIQRLEDVIKRFRHKPTKASFARAKKKQIERMQLVEKPQEDDVRIFTGEIAPLQLGSKWVLEAEHLKIGYDKAISELSLRVRRGQKIGILGANGVGKTTFLKTIAGIIQPVKGDFSLGSHVTLGYFDQHSAQIQSEKSVAEHFHELFPSMTEKEVRSTLGAYLFGGREAAKKVSSLSGGERARLVLAELLQSRPNLLVLDEPTNHMDIQAKETLESAFQAYTGTILFVSHDRYFIRQVADSILIFNQQGVMYYPFGYEHYLERSRREAGGESLTAQVRAEDAALIAGIRAVPRAERHRLREIPTEEAYLDWKLRLVMERLIPAAEQYRDLEAACYRLEEEQRQSEAWWMGLEDPEMETRKNQLYAQREAAWNAWNDCCLEWLEVKQEQPCF